MGADFFAPGAGRAAYEARQRSWRARQPEGARPPVPWHALTREQRADEEAGAQAAMAARPAVRILLEHLAAMTRQRDVIAADLAGECGTSSASVIAGVEAEIASAEAERLSRAGEAPR